MIDRYRRGKGRPVDTSKGPFIASLKLTKAELYLLYRELVLHIEADKGLQPDEREVVHGLLNRIAKYPGIDNEVFW